MTAPAAASVIPRRRMRSDVRDGTLVLGEPILIGHGAHATTAHDGGPWASGGDRLIVVSADGALAGVEVVGVDRATNPRLRVITGKLAPGDVRVMRAPVLPLDRRALVRRARIELRSAP